MAVYVPVLVAELAPITEPLEGTVARYGFRVVFHSVAARLGNRCKREVVLPFRGGSSLI